MREPDAELQWRTSSYSGGAQQCVEVAQDPEGGRWLRDTKDRTRPAHYYTAAEWEAFIRGVKDGEFD
ncbi:DUF397 domain-containing protein [Actinoalloteichus caeruleus]|uniref:DUF397 domain-containing protein n=1 Tax=Actinoalloteichus cyanogriseus TaxID=2893586 RepID=UPI003AAC8C38